MERLMEERIATVIKEESCTRLHSEASGPPRIRTASAATKPGITGVQEETHRCYNCGKVGYPSNICQRPPKEREIGGRGQPGGCGRGRDDSRGGPIEDYQTNLKIAKKEK